MPVPPIPSVRENPLVLASAAAHRSGPVAARERSVAYARDARALISRAAGFARPLNAQPLNVRR